MQSFLIKFHSGSSQLQGKKSTETIPPVSVLFHIFYLLLFAFFCLFYFSDC